MNVPTTDDTERYLRGDALIGNDFNADEILCWYRDEEEGYANLGAMDRDSYRYVYHALNRLHGFSHLGDRTFDHALGVGSAYGEEFRPVIDRLGRITILDPSDQMVVKEIENVPVSYKKPDPMGDIDFPDGTFDLVTCFGVLHHIPNVSHVVAEIGRVLRPGAFVLLREPVVNMGDWRKPRPGLTRRERGIPRAIMRDAIRSAGLDVVSEKPCDFPPLLRLAKGVRLPEFFNSVALTRLDAFASGLFSWNIRYNRTRRIHKFAPASVSWVCSKPA